MIPSGSPITTLAAAPRWVAWRSETRKGKTTKVPYTPGTTRWARTDDPETWGSYDDACAMKGCSGPGLVLTGLADVTALDLDHCRDAVSGRIEPWALAICERAQSYTEVSPSGTGLHILGLAPTLPATTTVLPMGQGQQCEIYAGGATRYVCVTWHVLDEYPSQLNDITGIVRELLDAARRLKPAPTQQANDNPKPNGNGGAGILDSLPNEYSRAEWVRLGMAAKAVGGTLAEFDRWSALHPSYDMAETARVWGSLKPNGAINGATLAYEARQHGLGIPAEPKPADGPPRKMLRVREPLGRDRRDITERPWEIEKLAMRGEITVIVAPPGVGKTTLTQQIAHAATSAADFGGFSIPKPLKVLVCHWEDDEAEMDRKAQAIEERMGANPHPENLKTVYCGAGDDEDDDDLILARYDAKSDKFTPTPGFDDLSAIIAAERPNLVVVDPLTNAFEGAEGSELLRRMGRLMRKLARRHDIAVILILHTKKYADEMAGNMDAARNAGGLVGRIRVGLTLFPMTKEEAERHGIAPARRRRFVRLDDGKQSYAETDETKWFEIRETLLRLDEERTVAVGVFDPWQPVPLFDGLSIPTIRAILRDIDQGVIVDGEPTGELYRPRSDAHHWAGEIIIRHMPTCTKARAKSILASWRREGVLIEAAFPDAKQRKTRPGGLRSNPAKTPGAPT